MKKFLFLSAIVISSFTSFAQTQEEVAAANEVEAAIRQVKVKNLNISLISVLGNPDKYDGKMIQVKGYLHMEVNSSALYIHEADYKNKITANAFAVTFDEKFQKKKNPLDYSDKYVILIGRFDVGDKGGRAAEFSGSVKNIIRLD